MPLLERPGSATADAGRRLGLTPVQGAPAALGERDGYLVTVSTGASGGAEAVLEIIRYGDPGRDPAVRDALGRSPELARLGIRPKRIQVAGGVLVHRRTRRMFRSLKGEAIAADVEALLRAVKQVAPAPPPRCRSCGSEGGHAPILVNGVADRLCPACVERMQQEAKRASQAYDELPLRTGSMVLAALALAIVAAGVWAAIAITTNRMFWVVAIGAGALIGWGTTKAAGRGGRAVQVVAVAFTLGAVLLGQVFLLGWHFQQYAQQRGLTVNWERFAAHVPQLLWNTGFDTLFALGGGLFGALYAARQAAKPRIELDVRRS